MKEYFIKKGKHSSGFNFGFTFKKRIVFDTVFNKSCLYTLDGPDKYDINKLFGFSTTWFHQRQSARIGWRCLDGENIQVMTYSYNSKIREQKEMDILGVVKPNERFRCEIIDNEFNYTYKFKYYEGFGYVSQFQDKKKWDWFFFHYYLFFYFGGNQPAPHDMKVRIELVK